MATQPLPAADPQPNLLTSQDIADLLKVSVRTVERLIKRGDLPNPDLRLSRNMMRWKPETIRDWLASHSN